MEISQSPDGPIRVRTRFFNAAMNLIHWQMTKTHKNQKQHIQSPYQNTSTLVFHRLVAACCSRGNSSLACSMAPRCGCNVAIYLSTVIAEAKICGPQESPVAHNLKDTFVPMPTGAITAISHQRQARGPSDEGRSLL